MLIHRYHNATTMYIEYRRMVGEYNTYISPLFSYSISQMKSLEELDLYGNDLSKDSLLSDKLAPLTSLKKLHLYKCDLSEVPER